MAEQDWRVETQRLAVSDAGFAAGLLVAHLLQVVQKLSDEVASLKGELSRWREQLVPLLEGASQQQKGMEALAQLQATLTAMRQFLAKQALEAWQQVMHAPQAVKWVSRTMGYGQLLRQLVADAESATDLVQFARANSVRLEELARPFTLPDEEGEFSWLKPILEAEGDQYRQDALTRLAQRGITILAPDIGTPFEPQWQNIVGGVPTDDATKRDTVAEVQAPAVVVNGEIVLPARVTVWKPR